MKKKIENASNTRYEKFLIEFEILKLVIRIKSQLLDFKFCRKCSKNIFYYDSFDTECTRIKTAYFLTHLKINSCSETQKLETNKFEI